MKKNLMKLLGLGLLSLSLVACGGGAKNKETEAPKQDAKTEKRLRPLRIRRKQLQRMRRTWETALHFTAL